MPDPCAAERPGPEPLAGAALEHDGECLERELNVPLDPLACSLATALRPQGPIPAERVPLHDPAAFAPALSRLVRRLSWGGDGRRGVARIEVGAGALEGATLLIRAEGADVSLEVELPDHAAAEEWRRRLGSALEARGVRVSGLDVR